MATIPVDDDLDARLQDCVRTATGTTAVARYAVNRPMVDRWVDALQDRNPVYVDDAAAIATGRSGMIAPPTMVQAWTMPALSVLARGMRDVPGYAPYWPPEDDPADEAPRHPGSGAYALLNRHGFTANAATDCRQEYHRELRDGDRITCTTTLDGISARKRTAMGEGHFVTTRMEYADQDGEPVATQLWSLLRFRPPRAADQRVSAARTAGAGRTEASAAAPPEPGDPFGADLAVGRRTGQIVIPITTTFVIATAIATHDFYAIHHDTDWARSIGQPDIFTKILGFGLPL